MPDLIPELAVTNLAASRAFYRALGFETVYERPDEGFARIRFGKADLMLDQIGMGRDPEALAARDRPFGRGINLQITVTALDPLLTVLDQLGTRPRLEPETRWYRAGTIETGQRQVWVDDPDGYLLRFCEMLGDRPAGAA